MKEGASVDLFRTDRSQSEIDRGYCALIRRYLHDKRISDRELERTGVIKSRRHFARRLEAGSLSQRECHHLMAQLGIDPIRAHVAIIAQGDPDQYFDPICEFVSAMAEELSAVLTERAAACQGDFEPIRRSLCRSMASRFCDQVMEHQQRVHAARHQAFA